MEYHFSLKAARVYAGLTIKEASLKIGVSYSTLQNWEAGKTEPKATQLDEMAELYGINRQDIFLITKST